jgi:hypothetical protein
VDDAVSDRILLTSRGDSPAAFCPRSTPDLRLRERHQIWFTAIKPTNTESVKAALAAGGEIW